MATVQCDIAIIGGGSAGYAAARTAHAASANVAVIDQGPWGGLCILRGCMPSKAILRSAEIASHLDRAAEFGLAPVEVRADLAAIVERKARLVADFAAYRREQLSDARCALYEARGRFLSPQKLQAGDDIIEAGHFIIATGSTTHHVPIPGLDQVG
ncbi:MAG: FAD-dependent oxidoreductase, partial [Gemmatimonadetes bacterium]|nr:FAD-dependent oxidoreductase [Gemmatimonadota bacterium]